MTNEELLQDLKQFVTAAISQATADLATKNDVKEEVRQAEKRLTERIDTLDEKLDVIQDAMSEDAQKRNAKLNNHETRLVKLEKRAA